MAQRQHAERELKRAHQFIRDQVPGYYGDLHDEQTTETKISDAAAVHRQLKKEVEPTRNDCREAARSDPERMESRLDFLCRKWEDEAETQFLTAIANKDRDEVRIPALSSGSIRLRQVQFVRDAMSKAAPGDKRAIALAGVDAYLDAPVIFPFLERDRIAHPLFDGDDELITLGLAGLVEARISLYGDVRRALASGGANPTEEKHRLLPAAVYEAALRPGAGITLSQFVTRTETALKKLGNADMPRRERKISGVDEGGASVTKVKRYDAEVSGGLGRSGEEDDVPDQLSLLRHRQQRNDPSSDHDGFSNHTLSVMELQESIERADPTARPLDMLTRNVVGYSSKEIADDYGTTVSNVDATVSQTRKKLRDVRESIRHPDEKPR